MKIAIVGTGISGLVAAYRLQAEHDVTVFESDSRIGGHTNTVSIQLEDESHEIDTGFIVFNPINYPQFNSLLESLRVDSQPTSMSFSVANADGSFEYNGTNLNRLFAQRSNLLRPRFYRFIGDIIRFGKELKAYLSNPDGTEQTVGEFLEGRGYGELFKSRYLLPLGAVLWSCPTATFESFPILFVGEFLANHFMLQVGGRPQWRVIRGGSQRYVERLTETFSERIRLHTPVLGMIRREDGVLLETRQGCQFFDHVVLACHADQALRIIKDPTRDESEILSLFPYQKNEVYLHTDSTVLPKRKRAWASWNAKIFPDASGEKTVVSYNMNILQSLRSQHVFCVTLNDLKHIREDLILKQFTYAHPLFQVSKREAQRLHQKLLVENHTSFCGAYWGSGFHEDGVQSALRVVDAVSRKKVEVLQ